VVLREAAGGRAFVLTGPSVVVDAVALARRASRLDVANYKPDPLYLRAPHVTLPA
jgi:hypothetical protein